FFFQAEDGIRDRNVTGVQTCALPISKPAPYQDDLLLSLHDMKTMDLHQENLAKQIGDKNRLIRGVAGSGKTLILASRAKLLAKQHPDWKILILCYNISLASYI